MANCAEGHVARRLVEIGAGAREEALAASSTRLTSAIGASHSAAAKSVIRVSAVLSRKRVEIMLGESPRRAPPRRCCQPAARLSRCRSCATHQNGTSSSRSSAKPPPPPPKPPPRRRRRRCAPPPPPKRAAAEIVAAAANRHAADRAPPPPPPLPPPGAPSSIVSTLLKPCSTISVEYRSWPCASCHLRVCSWPSI